MEDRRWSPETAWEWYNARPWIRGCNFMSSDCVNRIDQWQALGFEEKLATAEKELELASKTGFNAVRLILEYIVWKEEHDGFMARFDRYLDACYKFGIRAMIVFGNDCMLPKEDPNAHLHCGPQHYDWGYHGGRRISQHSTIHTEPGYSLLDEPEEAPHIYEFVREIIEKYKNDDRILIWDLYNEPGNGRRDPVTLPHVKKFFEIAREVDPMQPLTSAVWRMKTDPDAVLPEAEQYVLDHSDIVSYHSYASYDENIMLLQKLKKLGRPILNTEWLARTQHNTIQELFPLFYLEKVGCFNWGFVAGLYQTYEPWNTVWETYENGGARDVDFRLWFHDLYRPSLHPYDPHEIEIIRKYTERADREFEEG